MKKVLYTTVVLVALICAQPSAAGIGISPRLALPLGNFSDIVSTGFGASVVMDKEVKGKPGRLGLTFLTFGEGNRGTSTAIGIFAGYRRDFGAVYGKFDANLYRISTEIEVFAAKNDDSEIKVKLTPGIGYRMGNLAAEVDIDLAGDWAGVNLYYMLGSGE
jgi:hypothetical protein